MPPIRKRTQTIMAIETSIPPNSDASLGLLSSSYPTSNTTFK